MSNLSRSLHTLCELVPFYISSKIGLCNVFLGNSECYNRSNILLLIWNKQMLFGQFLSSSTKLSSSDNDDFDEQPEHQHGAVVEESKPELKEPSMYQVVLLNDDYTPMEFVVDVLVQLFSKNRVQATKIMLQVHHEGKGVCGKYTCEIAETKVSQVNDYAKQSAHPLIAVMEKVSS